MTSSTLTVAEAARSCMTCGGCGWVCENHRDRPWKGAFPDYMACECGAGAPCGSCSLEMAAAGYVDAAASPLRDALEGACGLIESAERETDWISGDSYGESAVVGLRAVLARATGGAK